VEFTEAQRADISGQAEGKTVSSLEYEAEGGYWVMTFGDDSEISFRLMAELGG
jgi:hypothetical protein